MLTYQTYHEGPANLQPTPALANGLEKQCTCVDHLSLIDLTIDNNYNTVVLKENTYSTLCNIIFVPVGKQQLNTIELSLVLEQL